MPCARNSAGSFAFTCDLLRFRFEHIDEQPSDGLALLFGIGNAGELTQKLLRCVDVDQRNIVVMAEQVDDGFGLVEPQQAVIDEHAGELIADRFMDQHGGDRQIDAAGEAANHLASAHLRADFLDRFLAEGAHRPVAGETRKPCGQNCGSGWAPSGVCTTSGWNISP